MNRTISSNTLAEIGALMGDGARANMMSALMGGQALTASELAYRAGVTAQTTSGHLAKLTEAGLLALARQGRHRYYRLASPLVGRMLESMMAVASTQSPPRYRPSSRIDDDLRQARTCYDHLAGRLGVALADALTGHGYVRLSEDGGTTTRRGEKFLTGWGIDLAAAAEQRRSFCRPCLDWSERRPHIAGSLGAQLADRCLALDWVQRRKDSRALTITRHGLRGFKDLLDIGLGSA
ncbi:MAG TPA: helix-turn-helix transcriptional regulator [Dongiaceae bacterium]|jgi:DNA-binding transcriptional ArsR family regulator